MKKTDTLNWLIVNNENTKMTPYMFSYCRMVNLNAFGKPVVLLLTTFSTLFFILDKILLSNLGELINFDFP